MDNFDHGLDGHDAPASEITHQLMASALSAPEASADTAPHPTVDGVSLDSFESLLEDEQAAESRVPTLDDAAGAQASAGTNENRATVAHSDEVLERSGKNATVRCTAFPPAPSNDYLAEMAVAAKKEAATGASEPVAAAQADLAGVRSRLNGICRKLASQLTALERAELLGEGYACHQTLFSGQKASKASYAKTILVETRLDKRTVQNDLMIVERLSHATRDAIRRTDLAGSTRTLIQIAGLGGDDQAAREEAQTALVAALGRGMSAFEAELKALRAAPVARAADPTELAKLVVNLTKRAVDEGLELTDLLDHVRAAWTEVAS